MKPSFVRYFSISSTIGVVCILSLILPEPAQAQLNTYIGVQGGLTTMTTGVDRAESLGRRTGFIVGGLAVLDFPGPIGIRPQLNYIQKGSEFSSEDGVRDITGNRIGGDGEFIRNYVELSVPVEYQLPFARRGIARLFAGPTLGWNVKAETKVVVPETFSSEPTMSQVLTVQSFDIRNYEVGLVFGGGLSYEIGVGRATVDVRYQIGLSNTRASQIKPDGTIGDTSFISFTPEARNQGLIFVLGVVI
jgi:hypothetical protein